MHIQSDNFTIEEMKTILTIIGLPNYEQGNMQVNQLMWKAGILSSQICLNLKSKQEFKLLDTIL